MSSVTFCIVDVFAEEKYAGNQLAVFRGGIGLADAEMQRIAREMNFSETTFILSETQRDGGFDVRIFTPREEVPFAGHPTLGTAHIIRHEIMHVAAGKIVLNLKAGQIPVTFGNDAGQEDIYWMKQIEPVFGRRFDPGIIAAVLNLKHSDIDGRFPIEEVSTGLPFIIVPLRGLDALQRARVDKDKYFALIQDSWAKSIAIFCPQPHKPENHVSVRMFGDYYGVPEDPATGSGNGCLAAYLVRHRFWGQNIIDVRAEQGYEIGRPSLLLLKAEEIDGKINVTVGGRAITIASGRFV